MKSLGLEQLVYVSQLFCLRKSAGELIPVAVKIVDDVLLAGEICHRVAC